MRSSKVHHTDIDSGNTVGTFDSKFLTTNRLLRAFSGNNREPNSEDKIVYVDGAFDMFHAGHVQFLEQAKKHGTYLIVGVYNDKLVNELRGDNRPVMNMQERVLSVMGCRSVDDVLLNAPRVLDEQMLKSLNVAAYVQGTTNDDIGVPVQPVAQQLGIFTLVESKSSLNVDAITKRIMSNEAMFTKKIAKKQKQEAEYYKQRFDLSDATTSPVKKAKKESKESKKTSTKKKTTPKSSNKKTKTPKSSNKKTTKSPKSSKKKTKTTTPKSTPKKSSKKKGASPAVTRSSRKKKA